ncbi:hypothetical protein DHEL01_v202502 [Diaporthe helianthi]|uniref:C2H2-type domain-containing protein n=1 Tax=Diaporthe helianthi TaxID=158607 RepID=A0A2P5I9C8_DIAHE|nr:hypothetical protein DHEL01_v202502 [Diaporthe helianthi]
MSQYNATALSAADNAGQDATDLELAPFLPTMSQSGDWNLPAAAGQGQSVGSDVALPPNDESLEQHAAKTKHKAYLCTCGCQKGFTKRSALRRHTQESIQAREHQCPLCDDKFKRVGHVEQHLRLVHNKSKDEIKRLLSTQKSKPHQALEQSSIVSAAVPTTASMVVQAAPDQVAVSDGLRTGPNGFPAMAHVDYLGSRPGWGASSAFFPALRVPVPGPGQVTSVTPAFTPQNFVMQAPALPAYYPAYPTGAMPELTGFFANPVPTASNYPLAPLDGTNDFFNMNLASVPKNSADGFDVPDLGNNFMVNYSGFAFNTFEF